MNTSKNNQKQSKSFFKSLFSCCDSTNKKELTKLSSSSPTSTQPQPQPESSPLISVSVSDIDCEKLFEGLYFYIHDFENFIEVTKKVKGIILLYNKTKSNDIKNLYSLKKKIKSNSSSLNLININYKLTLLSTDSPYAKQIYDQNKLINDQSSYTMLVINKNTSFSSVCNSKSSTGDLDSSLFPYNFDILSYKNGISYSILDKMSIDNINLCIGMYCNRKTSGFSLIKDGICNKEKEKENSLDKGICKSNSECNSVL